MAYPTVFGGAIIFSPALWVTPELIEEARKFQSATMPKIYFYAGGKESASMVGDMQKLTDLLDKKPRTVHDPKSSESLGAA